MAKTSLGKKDLQREKQQLKLYLKMLPSIDLKRTQLMAEHVRAKNEMAILKKESDEIIAQVAKTLPMIANRDVNLQGLVKIKSFEIEEKNLVGTKIPFLKEVVFEEQNYSILATPYWTEAYIKQLQRAVEEKIRVRVMGLRVEKLSHAVRKVTQHVNLFEKILIPAAKTNIKKIQIILGEAERNAVVRSKLAKALNAKEKEANFFEETAS
jgi:V/A-type H+-transporting ATPase subunit D